MDKNAFDFTQKLLEGHGFVIDEATYHNEVFGSWFICVRTVPRLRIVWDAREGWLVIGKETNQIFNGFPVWEDLWIERKPLIDTQPVEKLLTQAVNIICAHLK